MKQASRRAGLVLLFFIAITLLMFEAQGTASPTAAAPMIGKNFRPVALPGFGDIANDWAWSSAYYHGRVYIGTGRYITCSIAATRGAYPPASSGVPCPTTTAQLYPQMAAQIWSVDPSSTGAITQTNWTLNYTAPLTVPMVISGTHTTVNGPVDSAWRGMSVYTDPQTNAQSLYASGVGFGFANVPPTLLNSDGTTFKGVPQNPGTTMGDINRLTTTVSPNNVGMRSQAQFGSTFYVVITGAIGGGTLFASPTPALGNNTFQQITPKTMSVWEVEPFNGHLYISYATPQGYGVVRTDCTAPPPGQASCPPSAFTSVIPAGAGITNNLNNNVESMTVYTDTVGIPHLYVGGGITPSTSGQAAELTRINPDDTWDLIVGTPRMVNGIQLNPLSGLGEGFGYSLNKYMWKMAVYNNTLYVGTWNTATSVYINTPGWTNQRAVIGCNLWSSPDGIHFSSITRNGFGNPYCEGIRTMTSTPYGLFVGTVNNWQGLQMWEFTAPPNPTPTPAAKPRRAAAITARAPSGSGR